MRTRSLARLAALVASTAILVLATAPAVLAKEGVSVNLAAPLPRDAEPGTKVPAFFTMEAISDDVVSPLHRASVFIRLIGPTGAVTEAAGIEQKTPGLYKAMIEIPAGGAAKCEFGIHGQAKTASGKVVATDPVWAYDGTFVTAAVPPPADPKTFLLPGTRLEDRPAIGTATGDTSAAGETSSAATRSIDPRLALAVGLGLMAIVAGGFLGPRRRTPRAGGGVLAR